MIAPTRLRGLSEAYGSWKTICISRRSGRSSRRLSREMSRPSKHDAARRSARAAARGSGRASTCRSRTRRPGRASRPACTSKRHAVDGLHAGDLALQHAAALDREVLGHVARLEQHLAAHAESSGWIVALAAREPSRRRAGSSGRDARARRAARARAARPSRARTRAGSAARSAARRQREQRRRQAGDRRAGGAAAAGRGAGSSPAAPTCTGCCGVAKSSRFGPSSTMRPGVHHAAPGRRSRRPRPCRA